MTSVSSVAATALIIIIDPFKYEEMDDRVIIIGGLHWSKSFNFPLNTSLLLQLMVYTNLTFNQAFVLPIDNSPVG